MIETFGRYGWCRLYPPPAPPTPLARPTAGRLCTSRVKAFFFGSTPHPTCLRIGLGSRAGLLGDSSFSLPDLPESSPSSAPRLLTESGLTEAARGSGFEFHGGRPARGPETGAGRSSRIIGNGSARECTRGAAGTPLGGHLPGWDAISVGDCFCGATFSLSSFVSRPIQRPPLPLGSHKGARRPGGRFAPSSFLVGLAIPVGLRTCALGILTAAGRTGRALNAGAVCSSGNAEAWGLVRGDRRGEGGRCTAAPLSVGAVPPREKIPVTALIILPPIHWGPWASALEG
mmetsp:Transcript_131617/g.227996  ORF Transcript_131617/g.227996 Transcript_131617/m.227996 type:complete len:287 (-) Transcript_131617:1142-2002(-)